MLMTISISCRSISRTWPYDEQVDASGVEVLDELGLPLLIDAYAHEERYQAFQLYQRGVHWSTFHKSLKTRLQRFTGTQDVIDEWTTNGMAFREFHPGRARARADGRDYPIRESAISITTRPRLIIVRTTIAISNRNWRPFAKLTPPSVASGPRLKSHPSRKIRCWCWCPIMGLTRTRISLARDTTW